MDENKPGAPGPGGPGGPGGTGQSGGQGGNSRRRRWKRKGKPKTPGAEPVAGSAVSGGTGGTGGSPRPPQGRPAQAPPRSREQAAAERRGPQPQQPQGRPGEQGASSKRRKRRSRDRRPGSGPLANTEQDQARRKEMAERAVRVATEIERASVQFRSDLEEFKKLRTVCPICQKEIEDVLTTIPHHESDEPCHFECVQEELQRREELVENEKLIYFGNGDFAIVQERRSRNKAYVFMRKRITYREPIANNKKTHYALKG